MLRFVKVVDGGIVLFQWVMSGGAETLTFVSIC